MLKRTKKIRSRLKQNFLTTQSKKLLGNIVRKGENAGNQHFLFFFPTVFSKLSMTTNIILAAYDLLCANALNFVQSKNLLFVKELTHYHTMLHIDSLKIYSFGKHLRYIAFENTARNVFHHIWHFIFILNAL